MKRVVNNPKSYRLDKEVKKCPRKRSKKKRRRNQKRKIGSLDA